MTTNRTRIHWIDLARFIGIFAIIFGHTVQGGRLNLYVYSFHVSLFFFLQGITAYISYKPTPYPKYLMKKAGVLLVPYAVFGIASTALIAAAMLVKPELITEKLGFDSIPRLFFEFLLGNCPANRPLWFLPATFVIFAVCYPVVNAVMTAARTRTKILVSLGTIIPAAAFFVLNERVFRLTDLFFKAEAAIYGIVFFMTALMLSALGVFEKLSALPTKLKLPLAAILIALGAVLGTHNTKAEYSANYFGNIAVFYLSAFASIFGIILLCMLLPRIKPLEYIGRHTLVLLVLHKFPVLAFQQFVPFFKDALSKNSAVAGTIVTLAVIALCLTAELVFDKICPFVLGKRKDKTPNDGK